RKYRSDPDVPAAGSALALMRAPRAAIACNPNTWSVAMKIAGLASLGAIVLFTLGGALAAPATPDIKAYYGDWSGTSIAFIETDEDFSNPKRDIALAIASTNLAGFTLSWSTLQRQKGDPKAPLEVLKSTTVEFVPAVQENQWRAKADADPYTGGVI